MKSILFKVFSHNLTRERKKKYTVFEHILKGLLGSLQNNRPPSRLFDHPPTMGAILSLGGCAASMACCFTSTAVSCCCNNGPGCKNSTSARIMYGIFLLLGTIVAAIMLSPGLAEKLEKIPWLCTVSSLLLTTTIDNRKLLTTLFQ